MTVFTSNAPAAFSASHKRCDRTGSSAGAAVSQMVNGSQIRSTSALLSMLKSAQTTAASIASNNNWKPRRRLMAAASKGMYRLNERGYRLTEFQPYGVRHFLRKADPEGASLFRRRLVPLLNGQGLSEAQPYADIDRFRTSGILVYRTLVLRRSPAAASSRCRWGRFSAVRSW